MMFTGEVQGQIMKTKDFMQRYGDVTATCTESGYNPLLEDFSNTSFYTGHAGWYWSRLFVNPNGTQDCC